MSLALPEKIAFGPDGLVPVVVQDRASGDVLMVAWANAEALDRTVRTGFAHFWSRRRETLWKKGETSGSVLHVSALHADCDHDALLMLVEPTGPACHKGMRTCFGEPTPTLAGMVEEIRRVVARRARTLPEGSYTARLLSKGLDHTLKKVGEEAAELILAAKAESEERLAEEAADVLFHLLVVLHQRGVAPARMLEVLRRRRVGE